MPKVGTLHSTVGASEEVVRAVKVARRKKSIELSMVEGNEVARMNARKSLEHGKTDYLDLWVKSETRSHVEESGFVRRQYLCLIAKSRAGKFLAAQRRCER